MQEIINKVGSIFVVIPIGFFYVLIGLVMLAALGFVVYVFAKAFILPLFNERKESHTPTRPRRRRRKDLAPQE